MRDGKDPVGSSHRKNAIAIDQLYRAWPTLDDTAIELGMKKAGVIVRHRNTSQLGKLFDQSTSISLRRFHVSEVGDRQTLRNFLVIEHAIEDKAMESIASPSVPDP